MAQVREPPSNQAQPPLLEREADLAALRALTDASRDGNGRFAVIEGSAGIGKTRLLAETRTIAGGIGLRVLSARGGELEREFAFGIVRQLFEPLVATAAPEERAELFAGAAALAAPLFGEAGLDETPAAADVSFATLHGLYWLGANVALRRPTLMLVDDVHWADAPSLRWLVFVVRRLEGLPLMLVLGTRPPQQSEQGALVTELLTDPGAVVLRPGTLGLDSVAVLARDVFAAEPAPEFCAACRDATGGNPLYLRALLITLAADGVAPTAEASAHVYEVGPEPVARAVSLRLARLQPEGAALARAVAILGAGAELGLAAALAGLDRSAAATAAGALVRADLLQAGPMLQFSHPVVRAAVYEAIDAAERVEAHRRAARLLDDRGADPEQVAAHLLLVAPAADPLVTSTLFEAARRALARGAAETAVTYLRRALAEPPEGSERSRLLWELGLAESRIDVPAAAEHLLEALKREQDPDSYGQIALRCGRVLFYAGRNREAIDMLREATNRVDARSPGVREQLQAELISSIRMEPTLYPEARQLIDGIAQTGVDSVKTDVLLAVLAYDELLRGVDRQRATTLAERALRIGSLKDAGSVTLHYALGVLPHAGRPNALANFDDVIAASRRRGALLDLAILLGTRGWFIKEEGDLLAAEADGREALSLAEQLGAPLIVMFAAACFASVLLERGNAEEASRALAQANVGERVPESTQLIGAWFLNARGKLRLEQRNPEAALTDLHAQGRILEAIDVDNPAPAWSWRSSAAAALHILGRDAEARELASQELERARRWGTPRPIATPLRLLGLLEGGETGELFLRQALDLIAPSAARLEHAKALVDLGAALRRRKARVEARELLRQGAELAHECGATGLIERANEELAATGARPRKIMLTGLESLTASERRVAQLAAGELSNKEIAQALFVTVKTVEVHLSSVYRKLEIASRRQLAAALARGSVEPAAVDA